MLYLVEMNGHEQMTPSFWQRLAISFFHRPIFRLPIELMMRGLLPARRIGAGVVLFDEQGRVLLLKHTLHGRHPWGLPGGWLNRGESPQQAALRELREETGLSAELHGPVFTDNSGYLNGIDIFFWATQPRGTLSLSWEILHAEWFLPSALPTAALPKTFQAITSAHQLYFSDRKRRLITTDPLS